MSKTVIAVAPGFLIMLTISVLILPLRLVLAWFVASLVHELGHLICLCILQARIYSISVGFSGAKIHTEQISDLQECISALAGPVMGILLLPLSSYIPYICICALLQSCFNLLPFYPLDGGRAVLAIFRILLHGRGVTKKY